VNPVLRTVLLSTPTARGTWDPSNKDADITLTNGNRTAAVVDNGGCKGTVFRSGGKRYFEIAFATDSFHAECGMGFANESQSVINPGDFGSPPSMSNGCYWRGGDFSGNIFYNGTSANTATQWGNGDTVSFAVDVANHLFWVAVNGLWQFSGNPAAGTNGKDYGSSVGAIAPWCSGRDSGRNDRFTLNCGTHPFSYAAPGGFAAWG
jgi:hypothetical protein